MYEKPTDPGGLSAAVYFTFKLTVKIDSGLARLKTPDSQPGIFER